ncbi:RHS repeat domain-containing protein [Leptolyngbya sp. 7M]|uniref:RHS repeat domain-containing protein n=1 Tax=Leptolyngbya sp. 7M TaxID=2812896 RepID=UPI001B8C0AF7|nr:RHS repeat-associated core domain-containing protein [Leptolyngbya sp. 7M]QYO65712.1 RHS repeat-associated core domain-containing protein [Leptolyngbya sp. 7M]
MLVGEQVKYFLQDHLGSTVGLADASGNLTSSANYDSFGNSTNNLPTRYQYTGREYDSFSGLQYNRARWYDPKIGRFFSEDPIGLNGGLNLYEYAKSNPVSYTDPTGEIPNPYDFFWWLYYSMRCGEDGIQCGNACNSSNQSQAELELTMQEAFDSGAGNFTGLRYRNCFSANYFCEQQLYYSGRVFEGSHPLNPYKITGRAIRDYKKNIQPGEVY